MHNTVSRYALIAAFRIADNGDGTATAGNGVTLAAAATEPRILPDLTEASRLAADLAADKAADKAKGKARKAAGKAAKAAGKASGKAANAAAVDDATPPVKSGGKSWPRMLPLHKLLLTGPKHIDVLAAKMQCTTDDVRGAIDNLRRVINPTNPRGGKFKLVNKPDGRPLTFGYIAGFKLSNDMLRAIGAKVGK